MLLQFDFDLCNMWMGLDDSLPVDQYWSTQVLCCTIPTHLRNEVKVMDRKYLVKRFLYLLNVWTVVADTMSVVRY